MKILVSIIRLYLAGNLKPEAQSKELSAIKESI